MASKQSVGKFSQVWSQAQSGSLALALGLALLPVASFAGESYVVYQGAKESIVSDKALVTRVDGAQFKGSLLTVSAGQKEIAVRFRSEDAAADAAKGIRTGDLSLDVSRCTTKEKLEDRAFETSSRYGNYEKSRRMIPYALVGFDCQGLKGLLLAKVISTAEISEQTHQEKSIEGTPIVGFAVEKKDERVAGLDFSK